MTPIDHSHDEDALRRSRARRTALVVAAVVVVIYLGFILSGVLAS
jgi:hypothetical protein